MSGAPAARFAINSSRHGAATVVELHGELDIAVAAELVAEFQRLLASDSTVVIVDLRGLSFMDARGLQALIHMRTSCEQQGRPFKLVRGPRRVHRMLVLCNLVELFEFVDSATGPRELTDAPNGSPGKPKPQSGHRQVPAP